MFEKWFVYDEQYSGIRGDGEVGDIHRHACVFTVVVRSNRNVGAGVSFGNFVITSSELVSESRMVELQYFDRTMTKGEVVLVEEEARLAAILSDENYLDGKCPVIGIPGEAGSSVIVPNHTTGDWALSVGSMMYYLRVTERRISEISVDFEHPRGYGGSPVFDPDKNLVGIALGCRPKTTRIVSVTAKEVRAFAKKLGLKIV